MYIVQHNLQFYLDTVYLLLMVRHADMIIYNIVE